MGGRALGLIPWSFGFECDGGGGVAGVLLRLVRLQSVFGWGLSGGGSVVGCGRLTWPASDVFMAGSAG